MATTPEGRVKAHVRAMLLTLDRCYWFMPVQRGGAPALDYFICINGRFLTIETKVPGKTLSPRQWVTADAIVAAGGIVLIVRNKTDANAVPLVLSRSAVRPSIYEFLDGFWEIAQR
jgi:hypothetical protein